MTQIVPASKSTSPEVLITIGIDVSKDHLDDRADALMLARFGALLEPVIRPARSEMQNQLAELVAARRNLMRDRTATLNRLQI